MKRNLKKIAAFSAVICITVSCQPVMAETVTETSISEDAVTNSSYYTSTQDVTIDSICSTLTPANILESVNGLRIDQEISGSNDENLDNGIFYIAYVKENGYIHFNQFADYPDGYFNHLYLSSDPDDVNLYVENTTGCGKQPASAEKIQNSFRTSLLEYEFFDDIRLINVTEKDGIYTAFVECYSNDELYFTDELTIDPATGFVTEVKTVYYTAGNPADSILQTISYGNDITISTSPKDNYLKTVKDTE